MKMKKYLYIDHKHQDSDMKEDLNPQKLPLEASRLNTSPIYRTDLNPCKSEPSGDGFQAYSRSSHFSRPIRSINGERTFDFQPLRPSQPFFDLALSWRNTRTRAHAYPRVYTRQQRYQSRFIVAHLLSTTYRGS